MGIVQQIEWHSTKDRLPGDDSVVLAWWGSDSESGFEVAYYVGGRWYAKDNCCLAWVDFWAELPNMVDLLRKYALRAARPVRDKPPRHLEYDPD